MLFLQNKWLVVQSRQRHWGQSAFVITGVAIKFRGGKSFVFTDKYLNSALVGGQQIALKQQNGLILNLGGGVSVQRDGNNLKIISKNTFVQIQVNTQPNGQKWPQDHYYNIIINVPNGINKNGWRGACVAPNTIQPVSSNDSVFTNRFIHKHHGPRAHLCGKEALRKARAACSKLRFKKKISLQNLCVWCMSRI